eukprot:CAMPEP_0196160814 /NCGR_PEP_ID=MMETSP0910-20130528/47022_1 /TAXON_ID=49265 /ORGANISM="Thalassiosira rotula, Strain GSO102" /LENGTH=88 /DNA_ID=CAMNT_0041425755 /DNA_START=81 /DNA_END=347 /DNA_ORIENTATION=+
MGDAAIVQELNGLEHPSCQVARVFFGVDFPFREAIEDVSSAGQFQYYVVLGGGVVEVDDVDDPVVLGGLRCCVAFVVVFLEIGRVEGT